MKKGKIKNKKERKDSYITKTRKEIKKERKKKNRKKERGKRNGIRKQKNEK